VKHIFSRTKMLNQYRTALPSNALGLTEGSEDLLDAPVLASGEPQSPPDQTAVITRTRDTAIAFGKELIHALSADLRQGELSQLEDIWELFPYHVSVVKVANLALTQRGATLPVPTQQRSVSEYLISSRFLTECAAYLLADPNGWERLHLVTGIGFDGNRFTLDQMDKVPMSAQSHVGAKAEQQALTKALIYLTESGHALHALFHSHPGTGPRATLPSLDKDIPTHQRLEDGGYPLIGGIFTKDDRHHGCYVRFFSANRPFTVTVFGTGVTPVPGEKNVFQIQSPSLPCDVSYETTAGS
jgi:hypothetical protein